MSHKRWLPLEANPDVMNRFSDALGLKTDQVSFHEVFGIDSDSLGFVPRPVRAVILLFPINEASEHARHQEEERIEIEGQTVSSEVYFMKQTVGNACGTVALLHALLNNIDRIPIREGSFLEQFYDRTKDMTPMERAQFLENPGEGDPDIEAAHQTAASSGETRTPGLEEKIDLHFVCLIEKDGGLYELDGRKDFPIYHGPSTPPSLLEDSVHVIETFMSRTESIQFNIMALAG